MKEHFLIITHWDNSVAMIKTYTFESVCVIAREALKKESTKKVIVYDPAGSKLVSFYAS